MSRHADAGQTRKETVTSHPTRHLPSQPSLEQLRKQAKELLEHYRAGDSAALTEVARFEHHPDPSSFSLHDAQRVLARSYGYESWSKLKAFVDGVNVAKLVEAVQSGDLPQVRSLMHARPELVNMDVSASDEHRALHYAVLRRDAVAVRLLMEAGADARKGIFPHRDATSALALASDREYAEIVAIIEEEERHRRAEMSCPNSTVSPVQDQIHAAIAAADNVLAARLLNEDKSLIHACDRSGRTPIHIAAREGNAAMVAWLLSHRASVQKQDMDGFTALDQAALGADRAAFPAVARQLLQHGAELTVRGAIALGDASRVSKFIEADPGLLRQIPQNGGLLTLAVKHGRVDILKLLLDLGADVDERTTLPELEEPTLTWGMPLWHAALANNYEISKLLLERGADPNANVYASGWPLRNAWHHQDQNVRRLLLAAGAKMQPYMIAETHDVEEARRLLSLSASEQVADELVWAAADKGCPAILELALPYLDRKMDDPRWNWVLIQPIRGASADGSRNNSFFECMRVLLRHGVDPNVPRYGQTALHYAAARHGNLDGAGRARFAAILLDYGARFDMRDDLLKSTALGWACRWGRTELAKVLIERGAPINEPDAEPWATPLAWAQKGNHPALLALLRTRA